MDAVDVDGSKLLFSSSCRFLVQHQSGLEGVWVVVWMDGGCVEEEGGKREEGMGSIGQ
jgi:hypothetical protein